MISQQEYAGKRERVVAAIRSMNAADPLALEKSTSNLFRQRVQEHVHRLDLRDFNHVIRVDEHEQFAEVEGLTTYEELVRETLPFQLMPRREI
jgi:FAD/FMN-containing dehydrogenase